MASGGERICVVIGRTRHKMVQAEIKEAARRGAHLIELRLDFIAKAPDFKRILDVQPCPMVATVRRPEDGGRWGGTEADRRMLLRQSIVAGFDWVDLETDIADAIARFRKVKRIISYHNLQETPEDLEKIYARMCDQDPDVVKIAVAAQRPSDNLRVLKLLDKPPKPTVAFCLGDMGFPSRILGAKLGAPFTYAAFNKERTIALGVPSFDEMKRVYRYSQLNADTDFYGVIGDPVAHSLSPAIHNAAFRELKMNAVYLPFRVPRGDLQAFLQRFDRFQIKGYSVTIPHKEQALVSSRYQDAAASLVGSANTLVRGEDGFTAYNTDYQAFRDSLMVALTQLDPAGTPGVDGKSVLVLGAGGVARSVAQALHRDGALVTIANRTEERAQQLAVEIGCRFVPWEGRHGVQCAILVNCTPVGMHPNVEDTPVTQQFLSHEMVVFDTVYSPENTLLVKQARESGCVAVTGVDMFVRQAEMQFRLFTGQEPPPELMRDAVKRALSPVTSWGEEL
jgi:3-dehydroquinate dehydratase/shikimate dehydrogenase